MFLAGLRAGGRLVSNELQWDLAGFNRNITKSEYICFFLFCFLLELVMLTTHHHHQERPSSSSPGYVNHPNFHLLQMKIVGFLRGIDFTGCICHMFSGRIRKKTHGEGCSARSGDLWPCCIGRVSPNGFASVFLELAPLSFGGMSNKSLYFGGFFGGFFGGVFGGLLYLEGFLEGFLEL